MIFIYLYFFCVLFFDRSTKWKLTIRVKDVQNRLEEGIEVQTILKHRVFLIWGGEKTIPETIIEP